MKQPTQKQPTQKQPTKKQLAERLATVPLFSRCNGRDLRIVARHLELMEAAAGSTIVQEGQMGDAFFLLIDGATVVTAGGVQTAVLGPGAHFGELSLLDPAPRSATVTVSVDSTLAVLSVRMFRVLLRDIPQISAGLLGSLAAQLREARANEGIGTHHR